MAVTKSHISSHHYTPMIEGVVEEQLASMKQGIVTILHSPKGYKSTSSSSLRRTLSADMSSKNFAQSRLALTSHQQQSDNKPHLPPCNNDNNDKPPSPSRVVVVPIVITKSFSRTKSLEICTEGIGSETGSYSPLPSSSDDRQVREEGLTSNEKVGVVKHKNANFVRPLLFPPPIHSISSDGDSLQMQPRRESGRLVLEAVSVPPRNYFHARRGNGRLILTVTFHGNKSSSSHGVMDDEDKEEEEDDDEEGRLRELEKDKYEVVEPPNRIIIEQKSSLAMKTSFILAGKRNPSWIIGSKKTMKYFEEEGERGHRRLGISKSLPPPTPSWTIPYKPPPPSSSNSYRVLMEEENQNGRR